MHYKVNKTLEKVGTKNMSESFRSKKEREDKLNELKSELDFDFDEMHEFHTNTGIRWDFFKTILSLENIDIEQPILPDNDKICSDDIYLLLIDMNIPSNLKLSEKLSIDLYQLQNSACKFMCEKSKDREYLTKLFDNFAADGVKGMAIFHNGSITNCIIMKDSTQDTSYYNTLYSIFINNFKL